MQKIEIRKPVWLCRALIFIVELVFLGLLVWRPAFELKLTPEKIQHQDGNAYFFSLSKVLPAGYRLIGDTNERPTRSTLVLLRDGVPIGPAHTVHETIGKEGGGAFSHW